MKLQEKTRQKNHVGLGLNNKIHLMNDRSNFLPVERLFQRVHVPQVQHVDGQLMLHAHGHRGGVHHAQVQVDRVDVG